MDFSNWRNLSNEDQLKAINAANSRLYDMEKVRYDAKQKQAKEQAEWQAKQDAYNNSLGGKFVNLTKGMANMVATPFKAGADFFRGTGASAKDLFTGNAGTGKYYKQYQQDRMNETGAKTLEELNRNRMGDALETASWLPFVGAPMKATSMAIRGAAAGGLSSLGDQAREGKFDLGQTLSGAALGGAFGAAFPLAGKGFNAVKKQGLSQIARNTGNLVKAHPLATTAATLGALYGGNKLLSGNNHEAQYNPYATATYDPYGGTQLNTQATTNPFEGAITNDEYAQLLQMGYTDDDIYNELSGGY